MYTYSHGRFTLFPIFFLPFVRSFVRLPLNDNTLVVVVVVGRLCEYVSMCNVYTVYAFPHEL